MNTDILLFIGLIFGAVFLLMLSLSIPVFGENQRARKRIQKHLSRMDSEKELPEGLASIRKAREKNLNPAENWIENSDLLAGLKELIKQSGHQMPAYRLVLLSVLIGIVAGYLAWNYFSILPASALAFVLAAALPILKINFDRQQRMARLEEQLPEAIDVMRRALLAGHPFNECIHLVAEELDEPIQREFSITFAELNYSSDLRWALMGLLQRYPSVNVMALVTSVLIQRETGGNLAEIFNNLSTIIRGRFRFHRKVKTLSAEGRMSAWILILLPFALFIMIHITTPDYLPTLLENDLGKNLIVACGVMMIIGMLWIRRIIRIEV